MRKRLQDYRNAEIAVSFDPNLCIHWANCLRGLPAVFDVRERPWIKVDAASAEEVARVVATCPSGALQFQRLDGGPPEQPDEPASIFVVPNGPLFVRGDVEVRDAEGNVVSRSSRAALCRCGQSGNKPFCDNTHRAIGFSG